MTHEEMLEEAAKREAENQLPREEVIEIGKKCMEEYSEAMEQLAEIERKEFYRFFAIDYYGTGEGLTYFLQISRNYEPYNDVDQELKSFEEFVDENFYFQGMEELKEEEFMTKFAALIPAHVVKMVERKDQPMLTWQTHFHVNYS